MDPKLKQKYLDCGGTFCPFCGSDDIRHDTLGMGIEADGTLSNECNVCFEEWYDQYELKEVCYVPGDDRENEEVGSVLVQC